MRCNVNISLDYGRTVGPIHFGAHISIIVPVSVVISRLRAGRSGTRIPLRAKVFSLLQNVHTGSEAHSVSYSMGTGFFLGSKAG